LHCLQCVSERERTPRGSNLAGWGVTYTARVRISVGEVIREGSGAGHGIDVDLGQAHESALKEAETDAMKRALMTFGNPLGLALYDKQQREVTSSATPASSANPSSRPAEVAPRRESQSTAQREIDPSLDPLDPGTIHTSYTAPFARCHARRWKVSQRPSASVFRCRQMHPQLLIASASAGITNGLRRFLCRTDRCVQQSSTDRCALQNHTKRLLDARPLSWSR
jgi:hypothetical protein